MPGAGWRQAAGPPCCKALPGPGVESLYERAIPPVPWIQILRISCLIRSNLLIISDNNFSNRCAKLPGILFGISVNYLGTTIHGKMEPSAKRFLRFSRWNLLRPTLPSVNWLPFSICVFCQQGARGEPVLMSASAEQFYLIYWCSTGKFAYLLDSSGWLDIAAFTAAQRGHPLGQPVSSITEKQTARYIFN